MRCPNRIWAFVNPVWRCCPRKSDIKSMEKQRGVTSRSFLSGFASGFFVRNLDTPSCSHSRSRRDISAMIILRLDASLLTLPLRVYLRARRRTWTPSDGLSRCAPCRSTCGRRSAWHSDRGDGPLVLAGYALALAEDRAAFGPLSLVAAEIADGDAAVSYAGEKWLAVHESLPQLRVAIVQGSHLCHALPPMSTLMHSGQRCLFVRHDCAGVWSLRRDSSPQPRT